MMHTVDGVIACATASDDDDSWLANKIVIHGTSIFHFFFNLGIFQCFVNDSLHF